MGMAAAILITACRPLPSGLRFSDAMPRTAFAATAPIAPDKPRLTFASAGDFNEGLAPVETGGKFGYIDTTGAFRIPPRFAFAGVFSGNRAPVLLDGRWGYTDVSGRMAISAVYRWAGAFREGLAPVADSAGYAYIDTNGSLIGDDRYDDARSYSGGLAAVKTGGEEDGAWGFIDRKGRAAIPGLFAGVAEGFSGGLAAVRVGTESGYRIGYVDGSGGFAIDTLYDAAEGFSEGLAAVGRGRRGAGRFSGAWGYVDSTGRLALPLRYSRAYPFRKGRALVHFPGGGWAFIGRDGAILLAFPRRMEIGDDTGSGLTSYKLHGLCGYLDEGGKPAITARFLACGPFRRGWARVKPYGSGSWSFLDARGRFLGGIIDDTSH